MSDTDDDDRGPVEVASAPCLMGEMAGAYFGYLEPAEVIDLLNLLLECERAGAQGVHGLVAKAAGEEAKAALRDIAQDEARFCAMLSRHVERLGGTPTRAVGAFLGKLEALPDLDAQLRLLDRGQGWVADKLRESLPKIADAALVRDLKDMLDVHERNIERARGLTGPAA